MQSPPFTNHYTMSVSGYPKENSPRGQPVMIKHISAVTFAVRDRPRAVEFYQKLGFELFYGGDDSTFSSLRTGEAVVNLATGSGYEGGWWGRVIFRVDDVDTYYWELVERGLVTKEVRSDSWRRTISFKARLRASASRWPESRVTAGMLNAAPSPPSWSISHSRSSSNDKGSATPFWRRGIAFLFVWPPRAFASRRENNARRLSEERAFLSRRRGSRFLFCLVNST